jgi:hypothetical protein
MRKQCKVLRVTRYLPLLALLVLLLLSAPVWGQINRTNFGMQCGTNSTANCPTTGGIMLPTEPGMLRLWDSQVQWADIDGTVNCTTSSCMTWGTLDAYLVAIATVPTPPAVIYTFGYVPCWDTSLYSQNKCPGNGSYEALPPVDLGNGKCGVGSCTFNSFVTALTNHCSNTVPSYCVKDYIKYYEMWNEADSLGYWNVSPASTSALDLYSMVANPVVNIIKKSVTNAVILTPSITGNGEGWMVDWVCDEGTNTLLSNVYDIHQYIDPNDNGSTPELVYQNVEPGTASSPGLLYPNYFPTATCNGKTNKWKTLPWMLTETNWYWAGTSYVCNTTSPNSQANCDGQIARLQVLMDSNVPGVSSSKAGAMSVNWFWWKATIGDHGSGTNYATPYYYLQQYMLGGSFPATTGTCTFTLQSGSDIVTCPFTETYTDSQGASALWVWTNDDNANGLTYNLPQGSNYQAYWDISGTCTKIPSGTQSITVRYDPYMLVPTACP